MSWHRWLLVAPFAIACTSPTDTELLEGKACASEERCAPGYTCSNDNICVANHALGGPSSGGHPNGGAGGSVSGGEAGEVSVTGRAGAGGIDAGDGGVTGATGGAAGGAPATAGSAGAAGAGASGGTGGARCAGSSTDCSALLLALEHRYRFDEVGTSATDSVGDADGTLRGGALLAGNGELELQGSGEYVDLPNGIISVLSDATVEAWFVWNGGPAWQRLFDFGEAMAGTLCYPNGPAAGENQRGTCGRSYLFFSPQTELFPGESRLAFVSQPAAPPDGESYFTSPPIPIGTTEHLAVVVDDTGNTLSLYRNGAPSGSTPYSGHLSDIEDLNNWLGQSQYAEDPSFDGTLLEFRIYGAALTASQIATSFDEGPDPAFLE